MCTHLLLTQRRRLSNPNLPTQLHRKIMPHPPLKALDQQIHPSTPPQRRRLSNSKLTSQLSQTTMLHRTPKAQNQPSRQSTPPQRRPRNQKPQPCKPQPKLLQHLLNLRRKLLLQSQKPLPHLTNMPPPRSPPTAPNGA